MWYVIQVRTGTEENICLQCSRLIDKSILERCFVASYIEQKKYQGRWHKLKKTLFPGYIFVVSEQPEQLIYELKKVTGLTKVLQTGDDIVPLSEHEVHLMRRFGLNDSDVIECSEGIIEGDTVIITSGALMGMEGMICRIDRHKRKAWMKLELFGRTQEVEMGLEIVTKKDAPEDAADN